MKAIRTLIRHELTGMVRTWRGPVILTVFIFSALSGPALTKFLPEIISSVAGLEVEVGTATGADAEAQWAKDLSQVITFLLILTASYSLAHPLSSGNAGLMLARPIRRRTVLAAPAIAHVIVVVVAVGIGALVNGIVTSLLFDSGFTAPWGTTLKWLVLIGVLFSATFVGAATTGSTAGAASIGYGLYFLLALLSTIPSLSDYSPAGLLHLAGSESWHWSALTGAALSLVLIAIGNQLFATRPLSASPQP